MGPVSAGHVPWLVLPGLGRADRAQMIVVDRERLRSSSYARNALPRRFPRALESVVGDVDVWGDGVDLRLGHLKNAVHRASSLPDLDDLLSASTHPRTLARRLGALRRRAPGIRPVLNALAWQLWDRDDGWPTMLPALEAHLDEVMSLLGREDELAASREMDRLGVPTGMRPVVLALAWCGGVAAGVAPGFLQLLTDPRSWAVPTRAADFVEHQREALGRRREGGDTSAVAAEGFERPPPTLALEWTDALLDPPNPETGRAEAGLRDPRAHLQRLQLAGLLVGVEQLDLWDAWWNRAGAAERETRRLLGRRGGGTALMEAIREWDAELRALRPAPDPLAWKEFAHLLHAAADLPASVFAALAEALEAMPPRPAGRSARRTLLFNWSATLADRSRHRIAERLMIGQRDLLRTYDFDDAQLHWVGEAMVDDLLDAFIGEGAGIRWVEPCARALVEWVGRNPQWREHTGPFRSWEGIRHLVDAVRARPDAGDACDLAAALDEGEAPLGRDAWRVLAQLGAYDPAVCATLARSWAGDWAGYELGELGRLGDEATLRPRFVGALTYGDASALRRVLRWSRLVRRLDPEAIAGAWHPPPLDARADWRRFPTDLHDALGELARHEPDAEAVAARVLSRDFPDAERTRRELDAIRSRLERGEAAPGMARRARSLEARLEAPRTPSPARLERLRERLERRARSAWLDRVARRLRIHAAEALALPDDLEASAALEVFGAVAELEASHRSLALRLLKTRAEAPPWDLRDEPANRAFLDRIEALGRDVTAWLEGLGGRPVDGPSDDPWTLRLEDDPIEVLRMGEPFSTCLAPGAFNFFSAVTNAADINKRVLYARDSRGAIRGRCLLALTGAGDLMAFRVYAHEHRELLEAAVRSYADELAERVGCRIVAQGAVRTLVASDWYDDGPVDLAGPPAFLDEDSAFRRGLVDLAPDQWVAALTEAAGGAPTVTTIWALLQAGVLADRPELVAPLLRYLPDDGSAVDPWTRLQVVELLIAADDRGAALRQLGLLDHRAAAYDSAWTAGLASARAADLWTSLGRPQQALSLLRRTRGRGVRGWEDDDRHRVVAAARATRGLHRARAALELFRLAAGMGVRDLESEIAALETEIER